MKTSSMNGILDQISIAVKPQNRLGLFIGSILGGFVPLAVCIIAHCETSETPIKWVLVAAGLAYSAITVFGWGRIAFGNDLKAFGFVVLLEGIAIFSTTTPILVTALLCLVFINAVATSTKLIAERKEERQLARAMAPARTSKKRKKAKRVPALTPSKPRLQLVENAS